jgi:hypothetical protein
MKTQQQQQMATKGIYWWIGFCLGNIAAASLTGLWLQWVMESYYRHVEWWQCALFSLGIYLAMPNKLAWLYTLVLLIATAGVWFGFTN